ncbi:MAG: endonuclease III [Spirochaetales bacterium]|nr:endonuclease III [Spirochaetales bacterium]
MTPLKQQQNLRAGKIIRKLKTHYPDPKPLLHFKNGFELIVATILAAQCTDERVNQISPELFEAYPTPEKMAMAPLAELERLIHSTGFFRNKARNLKNLAIRLCEIPGQGLPQEADELAKLPGVGRKTANVITAHLFNKPSVIVDTHFKRVTRRLGFVTEEDPGKIEKEVKAFLDQELWTPFSSLLNYHGRYYCKARKPLCLSCPLEELCPFIDKNSQPPPA